MSAGKASSKTDVTGHFEIKQCLCETSTPTWEVYKTLEDQGLRQLFCQIFIGKTLMCALLFQQSAGGAEALDMQMFRGEFRDEVPKSRS